MTKRWKILSVSMGVVIALLIGRLAYIQLLGHQDLSETAQIQQQIILEGADTRGAIYDRNGTPIAGDQQEYIYIIEEDNYDGETQNALNQVYAEEVLNQGNQYKVFTSPIYSKSIGERLIENSDAYILEAGRRYKDDQPAAHIVGYVNPKDNSGASGLELLYDEELSALDKKVVAYADVKGTLLQGRGLKVFTASEEDSFVKKGITTTLELGLQLEVEAILEQADVNGAIVVTKCDTGEIMASASTPGFEPDAVQEYLGSNNGELINKVTQGEYPPGSIFKIVVVAAALEAGVDVEQTFQCNGSEVINGHVVKCTTGGDEGHGTVYLDRAFAESCNCAFIQLGEMTGATSILEMAGRMGLGETVLDGYPEEKKGNLMTVQDSEGAAIANLAIGQGEMLVTPLQVARLTGIVANEGIDTGLQLVMDDEHEGVRCFSQETAQKLQKMMRLAAETGTGSNIEVEEPVAVKTGSAESVQAGQEVVHGWITGYLPADDPEYVITVFVEDGKSGRTSAAPLFQQAAQYIFDTNMIEHEIGF